jgi:hypothetical protein
MNATTHGILSVQPVATAYEQKKDWDGHRGAVLDALAPADGIEQVLAERVALCSWRLNRVAVYEAETVQAAQEGVVDHVRDRRKSRLEHERLFAAQGEMVRTDLGILIEAHPQNILDDAELARATHKTVEKLFDAPPDAPVNGADAASVLDIAAKDAVKLAAYQGGEEIAADEVRLLAEALQERLPGVPDDVFLYELDYTVGRLREMVGWLAVKAGIKPDASVMSPEATLLQTLRTTARYDAFDAASKADAVREELLAERRARILPGEADLQRIARYEAHLSREMFRGLHELEAIQARKGGRAAPLARLDVQT